MRIRNVSFQVWDLGGQSSIRPYWRCYYASTDALVFVVDSADADRTATAAAELAAMLREDELRRVPLLVLANKQDLPGALCDADVSAALELGAVRDRPWHVESATATSGAGLDAGFDWYADMCLAGSNTQACKDGPERLCVAPTLCAVRTVCKYIYDTF